MKIESWYQQNFEHHLLGRYISMEHVYPLLEMYNLKYEISVIGVSEKGQDIPMLKVGKGDKVVLGWSQMHGNESTTTKALFDFLKFISQDTVFKTEIEHFLNTYSFYIVPILNPDGAACYTRVNANNIDLNRDALSLSQLESQCLRKLFEELKPSLCLNLHDQRSIFGFKSGKPATISFLSPAADEERTVTTARKVAMEQIVKMNAILQKYIPGQVGRYDDSFNNTCVGDTFQKAGAPTILFEAGHYEQDYQREKPREFIFYALVALFDIIGEGSAPEYKAYFNIPENLKNFNDFILRNVTIPTQKETVSIAIQFKEFLQNKSVDFKPFIDEIGGLDTRIGHKEADLNGGEILTIPQESLTVGMDISKIIDKTTNSVIFSYNFI
ncbi:M14 family zinc carboxypeptidase [Aequorivita sp. Q41]|uniref:M14 family zinc carboxypeptidase n=1 Tax=Aequorivita sp. Q41 TaxID=3153300 RepID=UPI003242709A